ncbi:hypothetical protein IJG14_04150 [bacterium]|nr:hypothetical protein [bacterium]
MFLKKLEILWSIIFIAVFIFSIYIVCYLLQYDILTGHDYVLAYNRKFLEPEHGRYFATFFAQLFSYTLPKIFNIHPNDFQPIYTALVKGVLIAITCLFFTNVFFLFSKNENNLLKPPIYNPFFTISYITIFLTLFNDNYLFFGMNKYFNCIENVIFFEYPMSTWIFIIFSSLLAYYFTKKQIPSNINYIILLVTAFLLGLTVEVINFPVLISLFILGIYLIINFLKNKNSLNSTVTKKNFIKILAVYIIYFTSIFLYYIRGNDHTPDYNGSFYVYIINSIIPFCKMYFNIIIKQASILIIPISILFVIYSFISKDKEQNNRLVLYFTSIIIGFLTFFALLFLCGVENGKTFWINYDKLPSYYKLALLFCLICLISFIIDNSKIPKLLSNITKFFICISVIAIFHKSYIFEYKMNLDRNVEEYKLLREMAYQVEKTSIVSKNDTWILPLSFKDKDYFMWFDINSYDACGFRHFIHNIYPNIQINHIYFSDNDNLVDLTNEEKNELKFKKLMYMYYNNK